MATVKTAGEYFISFRVTLAAPTAVLDAGCEMSGEGVVAGAEVHPATKTVSATVATMSVLRVRDFDADVTMLGLCNGGIAVAYFTTAASTAA